MRNGNPRAQKSARLSLAELVAGEIAEAVIGGVFISFAEGGIVEDLLDELVDGKSVIKDHHADVNELSGGFADHADAE